MFNESFTLKELQIRTISICDSQGNQFMQQCDVFELFHAFGRLQVLIVGVIENVEGKCKVGKRFLFWELQIVVIQISGQ